MARVNKTQQSPEHTPMFDLQEGVLIDGLSPEELLECGVDPRDTVPLSDIFADDTITHGYDSAKYNCDDWTKEDYRRWGKWISGFVQSPTPTRADYITAYKLGLGPHLNASKSDLVHYGISMTKQNLTAVSVVVNIVIGLTETS